MPLLPGIFLGNLHLQHLVGGLKSPEQRGNRLPYLEIHGTVLDLQNHIVMKSAVQGLEVIVAGPRPVCFAVPPILLAVVYEAAPDD
ncbi:hypothetical protein D3C75_959210 [compost metagenome]